MSNTTTSDRPVYSAVTDGSPIQMAIWDGRDFRLSKLLVDSVKEQFEKVVVDLEDNLPDYAAPLRSLNVQVSERTDSISTDGIRIYLNPVWWTTKPHKELRHCAAFMSRIISDDLIHRRDAVENVNWEIWNIAANLLINRQLIDQGVGILPTEGAFITSIKSSMAVEEVYGRLALLSEEELSKAVWPL